MLRRRLLIDDDVSGEADRSSSSSSCRVANPKQQASDSLQLRRLEPETTAFLSLLSPRGPNPPLSYAQALKSVQAAAAAVRMKAASRAYLISPLRVC